MIKTVQQFVWLIVASATLLAQVVPQACTGDCDHGCCAAEVRECCSACPATPAEPPCQCRLDARNDQPLSVDRGTSSGHDLLGRATIADATCLEAPRTLGASREYVAASLAVPIRPVRILCGVWRN